MDGSSRRSASGRLRALALVSLVIGASACAVRTPPRLDLELASGTEWASLEALLESSAVATVEIRPADVRELGTAEEVHGVVAEVDPAGLLLGAARGLPGRPRRGIGTLRVPREAVRRVTVTDFREDPTSDGALKGMAIGAGALGLFGFVSPEHEQPTFGLLTAALGGAIGALWGWHIDRNELDEEVVTVYRATGR